jgi:hypothetical protein
MRHTARPARPPWHPGRTVRRRQGAARGKSKGHSRRQAVGQEQACAPAPEKVCCSPRVRFAQSAKLCLHRHRWTTSAPGHAARQMSSRAGGKRWSTSTRAACGPMALFQLTSDAIPAGHQTIAGPTHLPSNLRNGRHARPRKGTLAASTPAAARARSSSSARPERSARVCAASASSSTPAKRAHVKQ